MANKARQFFRDWKLPISMSIGVVGYFLFHTMPVDNDIRQFAYSQITQLVQPLLLAIMIFLSCLKIKPADLRPHRWHARLLFEQASAFILCAILAIVLPTMELKIIAEGAMLAFMCPTATASAVITSKLGGSTSGVVTYLLLCNLMVATLAPIVITVIEPQTGIGFFTSFLMILSKVFPLLIFPMFVAFAVRYLLPGVFQWLMRYPDLSFNIWFVALSLAVAITMRSIVHTTVDYHYLIVLALISLACCILQFWRGHHIGRKYGQETSITAGQAFGQKNTIFIIWVGLMFLNPITSVVGGFYCIWHNIVNSYQLYNARKKHLAKP